MIRRAAACVTAAALALALGGCITLFPKEEPEQLYTFGSAAPAAAQASNTQFTVLEDSIGFDRPAATDEILTVQGNQVAYIKGARWAGAAPVLFGAAVQRAFESAGGPARLVDPGETTRKDYVLKLDVLRFEARYDQGATAAPTIVVTLRAALNKDTDRSLVGDRVFEASVPASDNRVSAITGAFDTATTQVLGQLVAWVGQAGSS